MYLYKHKKLGAEIRTISGYLTYMEEMKLRFREREVLCVVGVGIVDNSCCGVGGCRFVEVPGYIVSWKSEVDNSGCAMSKVERIDFEEEKDIKAVLEQLYPHSQINFI